MPGHDIETDLKFPTFKAKEDQISSVTKTPQSVPQVLIPDSHEFQAKFHWHVEDRGIRHPYIKPSSPQLNGKVERAHRSDEQEVYQLLSCKGDVDLEDKLRAWELFCSLARPHGVTTARRLTKRCAKSYDLRTGVPPDRSGYAVTARAIAWPK